jgi:4'-phosphopantetheinyl transferase
VHVWTIPLDRDPANNDPLSVLSHDEVERAGRFHSSVHRARYERARSALRCIVGIYSGRDPRTIQFEYGPHGKPELGNGGRLHFNLSHSGDLAVIGLALDSSIGVDVEHVRPVPELEGVARRFFRLEEAESILRSSGEERIKAFFRIWTRKESMLKLTGEGLYRPLNTLLSTDMEAAHLDPIAGHAIVGIDDLVSVHHADFGADYAGALAYWGTPRRVLQFEWQ